MVYPAFCLSHNSNYLDGLPVSLPYDATVDYMDIFRAGVRPCSCMNIFELEKSIGYDKLVLCAECEPTVAIRF